MPDTESMQQGDGAQRRPLLVGVTGGIGSGKSTVVEELVKQGAVAFSADQAVHDLYSQDPEVHSAVVERWGDRVAPKGQQVDRDQIANIVFSEPAELRWLESLLHPLVAREWLRFVAQTAAQSPPPAMIIAEVPLLFEASLQDRYDVTIAVNAPEDTRARRVSERASGGSSIESRITRQLSDDQRSALATYTLTNTGSREDLAASVHALASQIIASSQH